MNNKERLEYKKIGGYDMTKNTRNNLWTVKTNTGKTITDSASDDWLKHHTDVYVLAILAPIKTIIIYD